MTVIELDGSIHNSPNVKEYDEWREEYLKDRGYKIVRFQNEEVYNDIENVLSKILKNVISPR